MAKKQTRQRKIAVSPLNNDIPDVVKPTNTEEQPLEKVVTTDEVFYTYLSNEDKQQIANYIQYMVEYRMNELNYEKYNFWDSWIVGILMGTFLGMLILPIGMYVGYKYIPL
jgi:predicted branched-subunit amino acid permease